MAQNWSKMTENQGKSGENWRKLQENGRDECGIHGPGKVFSGMRKCSAGFILWPGFLLGSKDAAPDGFFSAGFYWDEKMTAGFAADGKNLIFPGGCQADDFFSAGFHFPKKDDRNSLLLRKVPPEWSALKRCMKIQAAMNKNTAGQKNTGADTRPDQKS